MEEANSIIKTCSNCGNNLQDTDVYCACCGQKVEQSRITFKELFKEFFYSLFNADSTLWRTLQQIWIPGKLTNEYFSGKRKSYLHPARLFLFSWVLFFAIFAFNNQIGTDDSINLNFYQILDKRVATKNTVKHLLNKREDWSQILEDSLLNAALDDMVLSTAAVLENDWKNMSINELEKALEGRKDSFRLTLISPSMELHVAYEDLVTMTDKELFERYQIDGFINQVIATQALKIFRDTSGMIQYLIRGFSWMVLITIPFMTLVLYAFYFYRKHYLVEHLVFLLHSHALFFTLFLVLGFLDWITYSITTILGLEPLSFVTFYIIGLIYALIYPLIGFKVYYKSSVIGSVLKGLVFLFFYFFISGFSLVVAMILRFLLF